MRVPTYFFFCFSKRKSSASEMTTTERAAASDVSYPLCSFLPFQTANAALVCGLGPGGISISLRTSLNRPRKPLRFFWIFPARTDKFALKCHFSCASCLSLWERWLSEAKTERVNAERDCKALSVACGDSSPKGRAKGRCEYAQTPYPSTLSSPVFSLAREKTGPPEERPPNDHPTPGGSYA